MSKYNDVELFNNLQSNSTGTIYKALVYIRTKYIKQPNGVRQFCIRGGLTSLINHVENCKLTDIVLSILGNCCMDEYARREVIQQSGIPTIARIFRCLAAESIQNRACRALANICLSKEGVQAVNKEAVFPLFISFLKSTENPECQQTALRAIRLLASTSGTSTKEKAVATVANYLKSENVDVLKACVKTISSLTRQCAVDSARRIQSSLPTLVQLCSHQEPDLSEQALTSLINLSYVSAIRPELGNAGAIPVFVRNIVQSKEDEKPGMFAVVTALSLCCRESINRVRLQEYKGLETLLAILKNPEASRLHWMIISCFLSFRYDESSLDVLIDCGLIPVLVQHLNSFVAGHRSDHPSKSCEDEAAAKKYRKIRRTYLDAAMQSFDESFSTVKPIPPEDEETEDITCLEGDNKLTLMMEGLVSRKIVAGAKVFCIHSPSYQEVQNEAQELPRLQDYAGKDLDLGYNIQSPSSVISYCHSPDRSSNDWSMPSSPDRGSLCSPSSSSWSPVQSFRASSPELSDSDAFSPCPSVDMDASRYSPILETFSGDENASSSLQTADGNMTRSELRTECDPARELTAKTRFKRRPSSTRRDSKRLRSNSFSSDSTASSSKSSIRRCLENKQKPLEGTGEQITSDSTASPSKPSIRTARSENQDKSLEGPGEQILFLLSHLSQMDKCSMMVATETCFQAILDYLTLLPWITSRAERILLRLTRRYDCFEQMVGFGAVRMLQNSLKEIHAASSQCTTCRRLQNLRKRLLTNLSIVAESRFGSGVLVHMILTSERAEWVQTLLSIPYLVKQQHLQQKILVDYQVLEKLIRLPSEEPELLSFVVGSLTELCRPWVDYGCSIPAPSLNPRPCLYDAANSDVYFELDDGHRLPANKSLLSQNSEYFGAMLHGSFKEASQKFLKLPSITRIVAELIFHHLYGCIVSDCPEYRKASLDDLAELIVASDKLLLGQLGHQVVLKITSDLSAETVSSVYACGSKLDNSELRQSAIKYLLFGLQSAEGKCRTFEEFFKSSQLKDLFVQDVRITISRLLSESSDLSRIIH